MSESDSFEQESTDGISEQVDALRGFLAQKGLDGVSSSATDGSVAEAGVADEDDEDDERRTSSARPEDASFDRAEAAVESHWTSHGGDAPEHEPVAVDDADASGDNGAPTRRTTDGGWQPVTASDGEELDEGGGSSDGDESGQDAGSMS